MTCTIPRRRFNGIQIIRLTHRLPNIVLSMNDMIHNAIGGCDCRRRKGGRRNGSGRLAKDTCIHCSVVVRSIWIIINIGIMLWNTIKWIEIGLTGFASYRFIIVGIRNCRNLLVICTSSKWHNTKSQWNVAFIGNAFILRHYKCCTTHNSWRCIPCVGSNHITLIRFGRFLCCVWIVKKRRFVLRPCKAWYTRNLRWVNSWWWFFRMTLLLLLLLGWFGCECR